MTWSASVSQGPQTVRIADIQHYVVRDSLALQSPIDTFYAVSQELLKIGDVDFLQKSPHVGGLLLTGLVSATENYFRDILSRIIAICPISQSESADETINLGAVIWHDPSNALRSAFEHYSFTSSKNILSTCQKYTKIQINPRLSILSEFDKLCELRHGIVHAGACVPGRNAIRLQIPPLRGCVIRVSIGFPELQEAGGICTNLVTSLNLQLFESIMHRWADDWRGLPGWNPAEEDPLFEQIWQTFYSLDDAQHGLIADAMTVDQCKAAVKQEFSLA